jgi:hypothetical protein
MQHIFKMVGLIFVAAMAPAPLNHRAIQETGAWSDSVNGVQGRLSVSEDQPLNGTRILAIYLELRNVSDVGNPTEIYYEPSNAIQCQLIDANAKPVPNAGLPADIEIPMPFWLALPHDGSLRFRVSVSGYGIPKNAGTMVPMHCGPWLIKDSDHSVYDLESTFIAKPMDDKLRRRAWQGLLKLPKVKIAR